MPGPTRPEGGDIVRYGPGIPASAGRRGQTATEHLWRTGQLPAGRRRRAKLRRWVGIVLAVTLVGASGAALYLRFHRPDLHVSGVAISRLAPGRCDVEVTGRIRTNGAAGTISYQWVLTGDLRAPVPQSQSVISGQNEVSVTVAIQAAGRGAATRQISLQVLGPDTGSAATNLSLRC